MAQKNYNRTYIENDNISDLIDDINELYSDYRLVSVLFSEPLHYYTAILEEEFK